MEIDTFEKLLLVELNESITNESSLWKKSNLGIIRNDGLELFVKTDDIEISKPNEYVFKNSNYKKSLYKIAKKLYEELLDKWETELFEKIMESLKEPYDWKRSIWGITQKTGGIELKMRSYIKEVSVYNPSHEFKNSSYAKKVLSESERDEYAYLISKAKFECKTENELKDLIRTN